MKRLEEWRVSSFKLSGREATTESKITDIAFLNRVKKINKESQSIEEYVERTKKEYADTYRVRCDPLKCHWAYERSEGFR